MRPIYFAFLFAACSSPTASPGDDDIGPDAQPPVSDPVAYPRGCYTGVGADIGMVPAAIFANPGITGIAVSIEWRDLEAAGDNQFDWSTVDAMVAQIEAHHLPVIFALVASAAKPPQWLFGMPGVTTIMITDPNPDHGTGGQMIPVVPFWDPTFHAQKLEAIRAAGQHFANDPNVIGVMTAFTNYYTNDWGIPSEMVNADYSYAGMIQIGKDVLDTTAQAFPHHLIKLPIGKNDASTDPDKTETQMAADIVAYAQSSTFGNRFYAQKNLINAMSPHADQLVAPDPNSNDWLLALLRDISPHMGLQMVASASGGANDGCRQNAHQSPCPPYDVLDASIQASLTYVPTYLEFWEADAKNPDLYPLFANATQAMQ